MLIATSPDARSEASGTLPGVAELFSLIVLDTGPFLLLLPDQKVPPSRVTPSIEPPVILTLDAF
ncbi:hypothetical protein, partial [Endozoicomonas acroporae]|uniref:hypothetical protein n=1 Tax=Endozoicomonas acroporae TaxID=1701104 RepID=UPI003D7B7FC5